MSDPVAATVLVDSPRTAFTSALEQRTLAYQRCRACGRPVFPPRIGCPACGGGGSLEWHVSKGEGTIYAVSFIPESSRHPERYVALVDMTEGFRIMCAVASPSGRSPEIGDTVRASFSGQEAAPTQFPRFTLT